MTFRVANHCISVDPIHRDPDSQLTETPGLNLVRVT